MSNRYKGGIISATPPTTSTTAASGAWTLEQQMQAQAAGTWPATPNYIEEVFSTYLYSGNSSTQTITNGIDLSTKGGLVWVKGRNETFYHRLASSPGPTLPNYVASNATDAASSGNGTISAFTTTGFTVSAGGGGTNTSGYSYASWTFRKQPKFFDVVTYTGDGVDGRNISHNLQSVPGCIFIKRTDSIGDWIVGHRSAALPRILNSSAASYANTGVITTANNTSTTFYVRDDALVNATGGTYVAYLFAHNAGGFGLAGTDNVISCDTYTGNGSTTGPVITLGYEPQWILIKRTDATGDWAIFDTMRGLAVQGETARLNPNTTQNEPTVSNTFAAVSSTGFYLRSNNTSVNASGGTYIYVAIRRGPMKVPTDPTKVFWTGLGNGSATVPAFVTGFPVDGGFNRLAYTGATSNIATARLTGNQYLITNAEDVASSDFDFVYGSNTGYIEGNYGGAGGYTQATAWAFQRAPSFVDIVYYTGTGVARTVEHNLGAVPELMLVKRRSTVAESWAVYSTTIGNTKFLRFNQTLAATSSADRWNNTTPTSSVFTLGIDSEVNASGQTYINYLFSTCPGVSKVGSYSGTGATQTINCGFTGGAKFVLIKRTDTTGDWYFWDTVRGMVAGTNPSLLFNSTAAQVNANSVYTVTTGFQIVSTVAGINASGGTYIFLAIA